ncbi:MAG: FHA domain-containing protein [Chloroflexota bacterium]
MPNNDDTQSIPLNDPRFQKMLAALDNSDGTAALSLYTEVILVIDGMTARLTVRNRHEYLLGRFRTPDKSEVDLSPYGALHHGVSRVHAKFIMENDRLYIVDLNSSNGTYVRRTRLQPEEPAIISNGDEILLGRMRIQVMFQ